MKKMFKINIIFYFFYFSLLFVNFDIFSLLRWPTLFDILRSVWIKSDNLNPDSSLSRIVFYSLRYEM